MSFEEELEKNGKLIYTNKGVSMMPLLRQGKDVMVIESCKVEELKKFDAVLFVRNRPNKKEYILHRILKVYDNGTFWIVGDNCTSGEIVEGKDILGKLTSVLRDGKRIYVTDKDYLRYVHLWCDFYPIRFFLLRIKHFIYRCYSFVKRRVVHGK